MFSCNAIAEHTQQFKGATSCPADHLVVECMCRPLTFSKKLGDLSLPSRLLCFTQGGGAPLVVDRRTGRLERAVSATGSETEWRLQIVLQMDKGPNVYLNALPTRRGAAAWLLHFISKETEPLCSHVADIAQCQPAGNHRDSRVRLLFSIYGWSTSRCCPPSSLQLGGTSRTCRAPRPSCGTPPPAR